MAQARINVICETCGKEFTHKKICFNRKEADSYEEWAKENVTVCPDCYKAACRKAEEKKRRKALTGNRYGKISETIFESLKFFA